MLLRRYVMDEAGPEGGGGGAPPADPPPATDDNDLGEKGIEALRREREARRTAEKEAEKAAKAMKQLQAQLDELAAATATDQEKELKKAAADAAKEAAATTRAEFVQRILRAEVKAAAAGKLENPDDAVAFLDLDQFGEDLDDPKLRDTITTAIDELLDARPYLKAGPVVKGEADGGAKPKPGAPTEKLTPQQRLQKAYSDTS